MPRAHPARSSLKYCPPAFGIMSVLPRRIASLSFILRSAFHSQANARIVAPFCLRRVRIAAFGVPEQFLRKYRLRLEWYSLVLRSAHAAIRKNGNVWIDLRATKNGRITKVKYRKNSRDVTLDRAVYGALLFGSALGTAEDLRATTFGDWGITAG